MFKPRSASRVARVPIQSRLSRVRSCPTSLPNAGYSGPHRSERDHGQAGTDLLGEGADSACNEEITEKRRQDANPERPLPDLNRYSRHYYDVHQIWTHPNYGTVTASLRELAEACRRHKELMFRAPDHRYDRAVPGSYHLVPTEDMRAELAADYERMSAMIFGTPPAFAEVVASIEALEKYLNADQARAAK